MEVFLNKVNPNTALLSRKYGIDPIELLEAIEVEVASPSTCNQDLDNQYATSEVKVVAHELGVPTSVVLNAIEQHQYYKDLSKLRCGSFN